MIGCSSISKIYSSAYTVFFFIDDGLVQLNYKSVNHINTHDLIPYNKDDSLKCEIYINLNNKKPVHKQKKNHKFRSHTY